MDLHGFLLPKDIAFWRIGDGAPIWRAVTAIDNYVAINVLALFISAIAIWVIVRKVFVLPMDDELRPPRIGALPFFASLLFLLAPQCGGSVMTLSPNLVAILFPLLATMCAALGLGAACLSGAFAAVGALEGMVGLVLLPLPIVVLCLPQIRRERTITLPLVLWGGGFLLAATTECLVLPIRLLGTFTTLPSSFILWGAFVSALVLLVIVIVWKGFIISTAPVVFTVLAVAASYTIHTCHFRSPSASETFVRRVLEDLGERRLIIGGGVFMEMFRALAPDGVEVVKVVSLRDKEELLRRFDEGEEVDKKALVVSRYYARGEFLRALDELGLPRRMKAESIWRSMDTPSSSAEADAILALERNRDDPAANALLGHLRLAEGDLDAARSYLLRAIPSEEASVLADYARLLLLEERFAEAETWARKAVGKRPQVWHYHATLAASLLAQAKADEAAYEIGRVERLARVAHEEAAAADCISEMRNTKWRKNY